MIRRQWAIIVGIDAYDQQKTGLRKLDFAGNDAREVAQLLIAEFGYRPGDVRLIPATAKSTDIHNEIEAFLLNQEVGEDDSFLFFYAGHGLIERTSGDTFLGATDSVASGYLRC